MSDTYDARFARLSRVTIRRSFTNVRSERSLPDTNVRCLGYHQGMSDTPVGERPPQGGHIRQYETAAERARAWRERQRRPDDVPVSASLAEATLGALLERLSEVLAAHHTTVGELVGRVEDAVAALADPDAVAEELAAARAETASEIAAIQDRVARAQQAKTAAETAAREATDAANEAWTQLEAVQVDLEAARSAVQAAETATAETEAVLRQARADHEQLVESLRAEHAEAAAAADRAHQAQLDDLRHSHEQVVADIGARHHNDTVQLRAELDAQVEAANRLTHAAEAERARAEGVAAELRTDLDRSRHEHERLQASLPERIDQARAELAESLGVRHHLELDATRAAAEGHLARLRGELSGATARAEAAERLAQALEREAERFAAQPGPTAATASRAASGRRKTPSAQTE